MRTSRLFAAVTAALIGLAMLAGDAFPQDAMQAKQPPDRIVISPMQVQAASAGPADLRLSGPAEVTLGQTVTLSVDGLPAVDLTQTVGQQTAWIDALRFQLDAPIGADAETVKELSMGVSPWVWRLRVTWTPETAGVYLLICDWNEPPYGLAVHRVTVRDPRPPPPLPPLPPPPPPPDRVADQVTIVVESQDQMTVEQIEIVNGQEVRAAAQAAGQTFRAVDQDVTGPDAAHVQHAIAAVKGEPLPRIVFSKVGQVIAHAPLPATVAATVELIGRGGGK